MPPPKRTRTFVDASVLINAIVGADAARKMRALAVLADPRREFVATEYLRLEVMPIAVRFKLSKEVAFYERFFAGVTSWVTPARLIKPAYDLACRHGLGAVDALHLAAASATKAEFVSAEKPTKSIYSAYAGSVSIY